MTLNLLVDGDSLARTPSTGRLSPPRLDAALSSLVAIVDPDSVRAMVVISSSFAEALSSAQHSRFERFGPGSLISAPSDLDFRDFLVRSANDGTAIIVSNSAFTRQKEFFPWLAEPGSGRHVLARQVDPISPWTFVEARPTGGTRKPLSELLDRSPQVAPSFAPPDPLGTISAHHDTVKDLAEKTRAREALDDWLSRRDGGAANEGPNDENSDRDHQAQTSGENAAENVEDTIVNTDVDQAPAQEGAPSKSRRSRTASKTPRKARANKQGTKEQ